MNTITPIVLSVLVLFFMPQASALNVDTWNLEDALGDLNLNTGETESPPDGSVQKSERGTNIWILYNGCNEELMDVDGVIYRSDKALPLIQYGKNKGSGDLTYSINDNANRISIVYPISYIYWILERYSYIGGDGIRHWSSRLVEKLGKITLSKTYLIPPIHPSCLIETKQVTMEIKEGFLIIDLGNLSDFSNPFRYNFEAYFNTSGEETFAVVQHMGYKVADDTKHHYGTAVPLYPWNYTGRARGVYISYDINATTGEIDAKIIAPANSTPTKIVFSDAFGKTREVTNFEVLGEELQYGEEEAMGLVVGGTLFMGLFFLCIYFLLRRR